MSKKLITRRVLREGKWFHPQAPKGILEITKDYLVTLKDNFKSNPYVPVYRGHVSDAEAERDPKLIISKNIKDLEVKEDGLYASMEVNEEDIDKYNDLSAGIDNQYVNNETGALLGATLRHIAFTVSPYIKQLNPLGLAEKQAKYLIYLSDIQPMDKEKLNPSEEVEVEEVKPETVEEKSETAEGETETTETAKDEEKAPESEEKTEETAEVEAEGEKPAVEAEEVTEENTDGKEAEIIENSDGGKKSYEQLQKDVIMLSQTVANQARELNQQRAEAKYSSLLKAGKIAPVMKEAYIELSCQSEQLITLSDGKQKKSVGQLVDDLFQAMPKIINLSEVGANLEQGDNGTLQLSGQFLSELRKLHTDKTDEEFNKYVSENIETLKKHNKA